MCDFFEERHKERVGKRRDLGSEGVTIKILLQCMLRGGASEAYDNVFVCVCVCVCLCLCVCVCMFVLAPFILQSH